MSSQKKGGSKKYHFSLYIDSKKPKCFHVADRLYQLCQQYLPDCYTIESVDIRKDSSIIERMHIIAVPTLLVLTPQGQTHRFVGDLSQTEVFFVALGMGQEADKMGQLAGEMGKMAAKMREKIQSS